MGDSDDEAMKFSDVEDYQDLVNGIAATENGMLGFINEDEMDDDNNATTGEQQLEALANQYMMKSPATLAMRRKSSVHPGTGATL